MKKQTTRRALVLSVLSLFVCVAMLVGTTFAWFTDSVTSGRNTIQSGNLDVALEYYDAENDAWVEVTSTTNAFGYDEWEPGFTKKVLFRVTNNGSLALKYQLSADVYDETAGVDKEGNNFYLSDYILTAVVDKAASRDEILASNGIKFNDSLAIEATGSLVSGASKEVAIAIWMPTSVGNEANHGDTKPSIEFGINLVATQEMAEYDSFGNDYDKDAEYPVLAGAAVDSNATESTRIVVEDKNEEPIAAVTVPAGVEGGEYKVAVDNKSINTDVAANETTLSYDITLTRNGVKVQPQAGVEYLVEINVGQLLDIVKVTHNGVEISAYDYDGISGIISFTTDSFSPFAVVYDEVSVEIPEGEEIIVDNKIIGGVFEGVNPATLDASLKAPDSEYIAVNYEKNGKTYYAVSKRSETVILAAPDTEYTAENGNYTVKAVAAGKLYAEFSALQNNDYNLVYLLPGTYNEGTVVYVYSSADIIGLGDKEDIKLVKAAGASKSNRHMFNVSGTKADYIQVTISNMTIDVTADSAATGYFDKDNAAVQSIRKSKVKCYDLDVLKADNSAKCAFYVNGNNAVDGVKYTAYLYVENCKVLSPSANVITTNGTYKFYHYGLTYRNGTAYTTNGGSILNQKMEANDWDW